MVTILIRHTVSDYDEWKPHFDDHESTREEYGAMGYRLFREAEDPDDLVMLFEWDTVENAQAFLEESDLSEVMEEAGVVGEPEISFLDEVEATIPETPVA